MFDLTSSKLLILAIVALIVVGPKDLPILLRTVGKYLGVIRRQAAEFRHQFDEAIRDSELDQLKKEFDAASREVRSTLDAGARSIDEQIAAASVKPETAQIPSGMSGPLPTTPEPAPAEPTPLAAPVAPPAPDEEEAKPSAAAPAATRQEPGRGAA